MSPKPDSQDKKKREKNYASCHTR